MWLRHNPSTVPSELMGGGAIDQSELSPMTQILLLIAGEPQSILIQLFQERKHQNPTIRMPTV